MKQKSVFLPKDSLGRPVHAHGGQILLRQGMYYWIGEDRTGRNRVSCYRSANLRDWEFRNHILTVDSLAKPHPQMPTDLRLRVNGAGCNIERPKVLFCRETGQFVMWMHWELPDNYQEARCAVAVCDTIDGDYTYLGSFRPIGHMSRDCTVFQDDDGSAYFISSTRDNLDTHIYRLAPDYLSIDRLERVLWPGQQREAATVFKRRGIYFMLTSGCTGWAPNQSSYGWTRSLTGEWAIRRNLGNETTFHSQPTWVLPVYNAEKDEFNYWYLGDRWGGKGRYFESQYVLLPLRFVGDTELFLEWREEIDL